MKKLVVLLFNLHLLFFIQFVSYSNERMNLKKGDVALYTGILITVDDDDKALDKIRSLQAKVTRLEKNETNYKAIIASKNNMDKIWADQVKVFENNAKRYETKYNDIKLREDIVLANIIIAYSLLTALVGGGVTYGLLNYSEVNK